MNWWVLLTLFTVDVVTNHHDLGGLKPQKSIFSQFWKPEVWNQGVCRAMITLKALRENLFLVSSSCGGCQHPQLTAPARQSLPPLSQDSFSFCHASLCLSLTIPLAMALKPIQIIQDYLNLRSLIISAKIPFLSKVQILMNSKDLVWVSFGGHFSAYYT